MDSDWRAHGAAPLLTMLAAEAQAGYLAKSWGGVETGGLLLGRHEGDGVVLLDRVVVNCEHEYGPAFELSEVDRRKLIALLERLEFQDPDHEVVGWYRTTSKYLSMTEADTALADQFFGRAGQVTLIVQRGRNQKPLFSFFHKQTDGGWTRAAEFSLDEEPSIAHEPEVVEHVGPQENPFSLTPDTRYWYPSATHREAAATLLYGITARKACMALIGEAGTGKTFVLEYLADGLKAASIEFAFLANPHLTVEEFFEFVAMDLGLPSHNYRKVHFLIELQDHLAAAAQRGSTVALLIDNAHKLSSEVLEEIDLLGNLESRRGKLLQVVLAGQPELDAKIAGKSLRSLRQRISLRATLTPLNQAETTAYIHARMKQAGASGPSLFPEPIIQTIWENTSGIPRLINSVCSALLERTHNQEGVMTVELVAEVARDLGFTPTVVPMRKAHVVRGT